MTEIVRTPATSVEVAEAAGPVADLLRLAVEKEMGVEGLEKIVGLFRQEQDRAAAREFFEDLAQFQAECPPIAKTSVAQVVTKSGARFAYTYAPLDEVARTVQPQLHGHGFSYGWDSVIDKGQLGCTCTLRHRNGHVVTATFTCPVESAAGMSEQQKVASALTYARRQSLIQVLGLTTAEPDTDASEHEKISAEQVAQLQEMFQGVNMSKARLFKLLGVESFEEITQPLYDVAVNAIQSKKRAQDAAPAGS